MTVTPNANHFSEIGARLRAYRLARSLTAEEVAGQLGISRAVVYRLEKGEIVKIETLERLSTLLGTSLPSLMGVGVEYHTSPVAFFERMRQIEERATQILGNFSPISFLLLSDTYVSFLRTMLIEALPDDPGNRAGDLAIIDKVLTVLDDRRRCARRRNTPVVSVIGMQDVERFLRLGLIGRFDLPATVAAERRQAAREEIVRLRSIVADQPIGVQIGIVDGSTPPQTFQIFESFDETVVTLSPFRLGELPNINSGIAMITAAPEAVRLFRETLTSQWGVALKGDRAGEALDRILLRTASQAPD